MKYILLMSGTKAGVETYHAWSQKDIETHMAVLRGITNDLTGSGEFVATQGLAEPAEAKVVRGEKNGMLVTDGIFPGSGVLRVRDPRITTTSLAAWFQRSHPGTNRVAIRIPETAIAENGGYSWMRAAKVLDVQIDDVQNLIATGQLKVMDTFVTDRSFEDFCRRHGNEINMTLIDPGTRKWLMTEYGVSETADAKIIPRAQKHALVVRECRCGRKIAGNVYFRHVRHCHFLDGKATSRAV